MSDIWPDNLVEELAYRRCLIFLGSGISATAKNDAGESPDTWGAFLDNVKSKMKNPSDDDKKFVEDMLKKTELFISTAGNCGLMCIFRKNCASVPEERSAIPLQTEQSSAG